MFEPTQHAPGRPVSTEERELAYSYISPNSTPVGSHISALFSLSREVGTLPDNRKLGGSNSVPDISP